jgi:membrane associated rhomboid family serine protease
MGIYDREYYRDERSSFLGSFARAGQAWKTLIVINAVAFIIQMATRTHGRGVWGEVEFNDGWFTDIFILDPAAVLHGQVWRLITSAFLHSTKDWTHIVFNMILLWWAGSEVETIYGAREFTAIYLVAAVVSGAAYVVFQMFAGTNQSALGASGAIMAIFTIFALHYPTRTVYFFGIIPMPMMLLLVLYVAQDAFKLLGGNREPVAFAAHLGGAAFGFLYFKAQWRLVNLWPTNWSFKLSRPGPKLRVYRGEPYREPAPRDPAPVVAAPRLAPDSDLEEELDAVLEKVARHGKSSLTEREHQILMRASEIYRNRRK